MPHLIYIVFVFALGSCIGSFLNVVVWRLPQIPHEENEGLFRGFFRRLKGLSEPPSHCPKCQKLLKWYDNIPVLGWIKLGGKCRFCKEPFSIRYPIVEAITGLMFVGYYVAFFIYQVGPCSTVHVGDEIIHPPLILASHWWLYAIDMALLTALLAASLIDAEHFSIPIEIPWIIVPVGIAVHAIYDHPGGPGTTAVGAAAAALALGAAVGTVISIMLVNFEILPRSFAQGDPLLEVERKQIEEERRKEQERLERKNQKSKKKNRRKDREAEIETPVATDEFDVEREWSPGEIRREISKEMIFLLLPMALGMLCLVLVMRFEPIGQWWNELFRHAWVSTLLGSVLGGLVGGFTVWFTRILGSLGFGKQAMGMGDVDLMVAVGVVLGAGPVVVAFFIAPFFGIAYSIYQLFRRKTHEVPYGPYLSMATAFVILFYCPIEAYFSPGLTNAAFLFGKLFGG